MSGAEKYLGLPCKHGHEDLANSGKNWRYASGTCVKCSRAKVEQRRLYMRQCRADPKKREQELARRRVAMLAPGTREKEQARQRAQKKTPASQASRRARDHHLRATDPQYLVRARLCSRLRYAFRKAGVEKRRTSREYGIDYQAIIEHLGLCPGSRENWHIDHIRPLCWYDLTDPAQVCEAFAPENHQWLPKAANLKKGTQERAHTRPE